MDKPHVVVSGASIAGLSAAFWLDRAGWRVTLLERAVRFRDGGQNVDVRGVAREVIERMGLLDAVRHRNTTETGTVIVDAAGDVVAELPSEGPDGATAELEVLRGDLARIMLDAWSGASEDIRYGDPIAGVSGGSDWVDVTLESGEALRADLLVIAEGVRSATRDLVFGDAVGRRELGITMALGTIPRIASDDDRWRWYNTTGGRQIHLRPDPYDTTRAILAIARSNGLAELEPTAALEKLREQFADAGWQANRVLEGFDHSTDLYVDDLTQIHMDSWISQRCVLAGDAAWCVTPIGGGGASLALTSGYVLAASLRSSASRVEGLDRYESWMRPLVDDVQQLPPGIDRFAYPQTRLGVAFQHLSEKVLTSAPLKPLLQRASQVADSDRDLPSWGSGAHEPVNGQPPRSS